ncbi:MAG: hypothetical protein AB8I08_02860 [Sandaracinaceae bacterium]
MPVRRSVTLALAALVLSACGSLQIAPPTPARAIAIAGFEVVYANDLPSDRQRMLNRLGVPAKMSLALRQAYPAGPGPRVRVMITQFRSGRWGPTRMHAVVFVLGDNEQVLAQLDVDSTSMSGASRGGLIQNVSQDCVNQIAAQL